MFITEKQAQDLVNTYEKNAAPTQLRRSRFSREYIDAILAQDGCEGLIVYMGQNEDGSYSNVIAGYKGSQRIAGEQLGADAACPKDCLDDDFKNIA